MKIVVKQNTIIATHGNEQIIEGDYPGAEIFLVPENKYKLGQLINPAVLQILRQAKNTPSKTLSRLDFFGRFTAQEIGTIYAAARQSIQMEILLDQFRMAEFINVTDPRTMQAVQALEASGIIGPGRSVDILRQS